MRRTSRTAFEISQKVGVSGRRIEGWTLHKLDPILRLAPDDVILHYRELAKLTGPGRGRDADSTALRLASRGFGCTRLRESLIRKMGMDDIEQLQANFDLSTERSTDEAFEKFDQLVDLIRLAEDGFPPLIRRVLKEFRGNALSVGSSTGDTAEESFHSALVNVFYLMFGGKIYNPNAISSVFGFGDSDVEPGVADIVCERFRIDLSDVGRAYRSIPIDEITAMAKWLRDRASIFITYFHLESIGEVEVDETAALAAPYAIYLLGALSPLINDDAIELLRLLDLPVFARDLVQRA